MYKARKYLSFNNMKSLYFSIIHCYTNYANIACGSTGKSKLLKLHKHQKHISRMIHYQTKTQCRRRGFNIGGGTKKKDEDFLSFKSSKTASTAIFDPLLANLC